MAANGTAVGGVAWWAHVGGFAAGVVLIKFFKENPKSKRFKKLRIR
ncbi:MAG: rhomboid family intramembrane serine protease [Desulfobulbaceae bacterium]|nr:rhomboid family intramembrane serine protease [Desulfobulbaceae bacterium]